MSKKSMDVARMRKLDRWLGVPACRVLSLWRKVFDRNDSPPPAPPRRILFIKLAEQGSTVLAQSAVQAAIRRVGRDNVFFLLFAENRPILDLLDLVPPENVLVIATTGLRQALVGALRAVWTMRRFSKNFRQRSSQGRPQKSIRRRVSVSWFAISSS